MKARSRAKAGPGNLQSGSRPLIELSRFDAAAFDLDGVITRTATVHATAWKQLFDEFLDRRASGAGVGFTPFDSRDYVLYVDGKPRLAGVHDFLASRTVDLPEGDPEDPPGRATMHGLARRKNELFLQAIARDGVEVFEDAKRLAALNGIAATAPMAFYDWLLFASPGDPAALGHPLLTAFAQRDGTLPGAQDSEATAALALRCLRDFQQYQKSGAERLVGTYSI